ncbi:MAG: hypothetical protein Q8P05_04975 [Candidatus Diapherotrites archaeon]|nr:hypothetical protein [Candidatus Diapherotrites archaeon]
MIRRPETLYFYQQPVINAFVVDPEKAREEVRQSMRRLYYTVARKEGYLKKGNAYLVKQLT